MSADLLFDFVVNKPAKTVTLTREFAAEQALVWDAFTKKELLDEWWAPQPFASRTKEMDFKVGGKRLYAMVSPEGKELWALHEYTSITPITNFKFFNAFADADANPQLPGSNWDFNFSEANELTTVRISIHNDSLERMERLMETGFTEGMRATTKQLEALLARLLNKK